MNSLRKFSARQAWTWPSNRSLQPNSAVPPHGRPTACSTPRPIIDSPAPSCRIGDGGAGRIFCGKEKTPCPLKSHSLPAAAGAASATSSPKAVAARGYAIALHYNRSAEEALESAALLRKSGVPVEAYRANVADENEVARLFEQVRERFGRLDALVTAAAIWQSKPLEEVTGRRRAAALRDQHFRHVPCCRQAGKIMAAQPEGGAIVTLGDWATSRP